MAFCRRFELVVSLAVGLFVLSALSAPAVQRLPEVAVEAPADLRAVARRLDGWQPERLAGFQQLIGLDDAGPVIRVVLATEESVVAIGAPAWIAGYARGDGLIVLFPARVPVYPNASLDELLGHEVAHVLVARAAGGRWVPRWFNEGLAMLAEEGWSWGDRSRAALALMRSDDDALASLDARFAGSRAEVSAAYALSAAIVRSFVQRYGRAMPAGVLARVARGEGFDEAFLTTTGAALAEAEHDFWRRHVIWHRWLPFVGSSATLWIGVTLLALVAILRRRARDRALAEKWEAEERFLDGFDDETLH